MIDHDRLQSYYTTRNHHIKPRRGCPFGNIFWEDTSGYSSPGDKTQPATLLFHVSDGEHIVASEKSPESARRVPQDQYFWYTI